MLKTIKHAYNLLRNAARDLTLKKKRSPQWHKVEKAFLAEHPTCAVCGTNQRLNIHHCLPFHLFPELELDPNNLITLCMSMGKECHLWIGHGDNFRDYNKNVRADADLLSKDISRFDEIAAIAKQNRKSQ